MFFKGTKTIAPTVFKVVFVSDFFFYLCRINIEEVITKKINVPEFLGISRNFPEFNRSFSDFPEISRCFPEFLLYVSRTFSSSYRSVFSQYMATVRLVRQFKQDMRNEMGLYIKRYSGIPFSTVLIGTDDGQN